MKKVETGVRIRSLFSYNLRRLRMEANLSQLSLAVEADLTQTFINDIENEKKWVSAETIEKLAYALKVEPYQFLAPDSKWSGQQAELFELYILDLTASVNTVLEKYTSRFIADNGKQRHFLKQ